MFSASGRVITFHGFLKAYVEGTDDAAAARDDAETRLPALARGRRRHGGLGQRRRPRDQAAGALHRGHADQGARGARDRPPVDVRLDHRHDPRPRLRLQEGHRAGAGLAGVLGDPAARGALPAPDLLRVHRRHGGRPRRDRRAARKDRATELGEFYYGSDNVKGLHRLVDGLGDIDAQEMATFPVGDADSGIVLRVGRYGPYLEGPDDEGNPAGKRANVPEDLPPDELTLEKAKELLANPAGEEIELGVHPETGLRIVAKNGRYGPVRHRGAARGRAQVGQAAHRLAVQVDVARHDHASTTRSSCCRCRAWSAPTTRASRSPRRTVATGPTSRRAPTPVR